MSKNVSSTYIRMECMKPVQATEQAATLQSLTKQFNRNPIDWTCCRITLLNHMIMVTVRNNQRI